MVVVEGCARLPLLHHVGARGRVFLEERTQPKSELAASAVNRVACAAARAKVVAHRRHFWPLEKSLVVKQRQQVRLDLLRIHHAAVG